MNEQKKMLEKCKFAINELVLCYEPDPMKARMLYDAKVLDVDVTKDDKGRKASEYYIHFQGWNKSWDRWILEEQLVKDSDSGRALQGKLYKEAIKPKKKKKKSMKNPEEKDDTMSVVSMNSTENEEDVHIIQLPLISLDIPKVLSTRLENDCYNIKRRKKLIHLPRKPTVNDILNEYFEHCKQKTQEGKNINLVILKETLEGLNTYFNFFLSSLLLYNFERDQYNKFFPAQKSAKDPSTIASPAFSIFSPPITPLLSKTVSPHSFPCTDSKDSSASTSSTSSVSEDVSLSSYASSKRSQFDRKRRRDRSAFFLEETTQKLSRPRRRTISLSGSERTFFPAVTKSVMESSMTGSLRRSARRSTTYKEEVKTEVDEPHIQPIELAESNVNTVLSQPLNEKQNDTSAETNIPRLRRSTRCQKPSITCIPDTSNENDFMPIGSTAKSLQETNKELLKPLNILHSRDKITDTMGNNSFMVFPQRPDGDTPADIYGVEHLLRLFVKIPILLASSSMEELEMNVILNNTSTFLEYLSHRADLFSSKVYSESVI